MNEPTGLTSPASPRPRDRPSRREIFVWIGLGVLWTAAWAGRLLQPQFAIPNHDELCSGNLARGLTEGLAGSIWCYQHSEETHGTLVYGFLLWPFFSLGGSHFVWLKLLAGGFAAGGLFFWALAVRRAWGPTAAVAFVLLLMTAPPAEWHSAYANHMESLLFIGMMAAWFAHPAARAFTRRKIAAIGWLAGFGCFFCPDCMVMAAALAICCLWRLSSFGRIRRALLVGGPAFLLGYAPHWLSPFPAPVSLPSVIHCRLWRSWRGFFGSDFFGAFPHGAAALSGLIFLALVVREIRRFRPGRGPTPGADWLLRLLAVDAIVFLLVFPVALENLRPFYHGRVQSRYAYQVFYALAAGCGGALSLAPKMVRRAALLLLLAAAGWAAANSGISRPAVRDGWQSLWLSRGDNYYDVVGNALDRWDRSPRRLADVLAKLPPSWRSTSLQWIGARVDPRRFARVLADDPTWMAGRRPEAARGLAQLVGCGDGAPPGASLDVAALPACRETLETLAAADAGLARSYVEGLGYFVAAKARENSPLAARELIRELMRPASDGKSPANFASHRRWIERALEIASPAVPAPQAYSAFLHGVGRCFGEQPVDYGGQAFPWPQLEPTTDADDETFLAADARQAYREGLAEGEADFLIAYVGGYCVRPQAPPPTVVAPWLARRHIRLATRPDRPGLYWLEADGAAADGP